MAGSVIRTREDLDKAFKTIGQSFSFDGAHLELSTEARTDDILVFLNEHFLPDEPLCKSLDFTDYEEYDDVIKGMLMDNLSILLVSDTTDEILGVRTMSMLKKTDELCLSSIKDEKLKKVFELLQHKDEEMDVFRHLGVDIAVHFIALAVHSSCRKRGYASKLMEAAVQFSMELGIKHVCIKGEGTSNFSQHIYEKCGFETLHEIVYNDYKINGDVVFKNMGEHTSTKVYVKKM